MSLYQNFLTASGRFIHRAYQSAKSLARPVLTAIVNTSDKIRKAASVLSVVPVVGQAASAVLTAATVAYSVGSVVQDLIGEPTIKPNLANVDDIIFEVDDDAFNNVDLSHDSDRPFPPAPKRIKTGRELFEGEVPANLPAKPTSYFAGAAPFKFTPQQVYPTTANVEMSSRRSSYDAQGDYNMDRRSNMSIA